ncbi:hypothetical protein COO91_09638 (plasmid) [Nostoc flagelliforme CCNUN1]|uniref:Uncharacterized protein n=1 Tax=Nostoc flagelliforme CCNUN1 TaxID=2038116 RepID=A0A2K8T6Y2_9NOSO|nr:hypothetical protein [Nostoc flagelliforme]AUB43457.1 hypothetical protein COO91_09638 [Nostoc flagelliforme CCNUN1]
MRCDRKKTRQRRRDSSVAASQVHHANNVNNRAEGLVRSLPPTLGDAPRTASLTKSGYTIAKLR